MTCRCVGSTCCASAMDPESPHEFGDVNTELHSVEWKRFLERLEARDAWRDKPEGAEVARAALRELVSEQEERLETLLAAHLERESAADPDALGFQDTAEGERLRRYQIACNQTLLRILETLRKRHREADRAKEGSKRGRKSSVAASGVESPTEADLLRETFTPVIAQGQEPAARPAEVVPTLGGIVGRGSPGTRRIAAPSPTEGLPIHQDATNEANAPPLMGRESPDPDSSLVGRGSPDPAPSPTEGLPIHQDATNEANAPLVELGSPGPGMTESLPPVFTDHRPLTTDHSQKTNEPNRLARVVLRSLHVLLAAALTRLALLACFGLAAALATVTGPDRPPRGHFVERPVAHGGWRVNTIHISLLETIGRTRAG